MYLIDVLTTRPYSDEINVITVLGFEPGSSGVGCDSSDICVTGGAALTVLIKLVFLKQTIQFLK